MGTAARYFGNEYLHVLKPTPIESGYRAYVCDGRYGVFQDGAEINTYLPVFESTSSTPNLDEAAIRV